MEIFSPIVGVHFRSSEAKHVHNALVIGDYVDLAAEPDNHYDPMAVQVLYAGEIIGYVARANNYQISEHLTNGGEATARIVDHEGNKKILLITWDD